MYRRESVSSGIRLQWLIQNQHAEILAREKKEGKFIHLYNIGTYWVAFERSAYRLNGLFPKSELTLFCIPGCTEYIVMVSVPVSAADDYFHKYKVFHDGDYRKALYVSTLKVGDYHKWHEDAVQSILQ